MVNINSYKWNRYNPILKKELNGEIARNILVDKEKLAKNNKLWDF